MQNFCSIVWFFIHPYTPYFCDLYETAFKSAKQILIDRELAGDLEQVFHKS